MNGIYQHYIIDLSSNNNFVQVPTVQGDGNNIRGFEVELIENSVPYIIDKTDCVISIMGTKPDTKQIMNECHLTDDGYILVDITSQMSAVKGRGDYQIVLMSRSTNSQLKSFPFYIITTPAAFDVDYVISSDEFQLLTNQIMKTDKVISEANKTIADIKDLESTIEGQEEVRTENEDLRKSAENIRKENEINRQNAETQRVANETARETAENNRKETFETLMDNIDIELTKIENVNVEAIEDTNSFKVKVTDREGQSSTSPNLLNTIQIGIVETGDSDENPTASITGTFGNQKLNLRLPSGKPFKIQKIYTSVSAMNEDINNINLYDFIMIHTGSVEDEDTGKLYMKGTSGILFITDLSGVQGIQGVKGDTGVTPNLSIGTVTTGAPGTQASATITGTAENPVINLVIPRGNTGTFENASAANIPFDGINDANSIKDVVNGKVDKVAGQGLVSDAERSAWNQTYQQATGYTNQKIADLIGSAPSTLDTLGEIAQAMAENDTVVDALEAAIGSKANQVEMESILGTKLDKTGDSKDATVTFTSGDALTPSSWTDVAVLTTGEKHRSLFNKISTMFKNIRYLYKMLGGFSFYPEELTQEEYEALPENTKSTPKMLFVIKKEDS